MKKRIVLLAMCLLFLICTCGCKKESYPFPNKGEPIDSIELLYYPWADDNDNEEWMHFVLIRKLEEEEIPVFMERVYELETRKQDYGEPLCDYGPKIARVNYVNGDAEYFGSWNIVLEEAGEPHAGISIYYFYGEGFEDLFYEYAGGILHLRK